MVPYVRMSYAKHLKNAVRYIGSLNYFSSDFAEQLIKEMPNEIQIHTEKGDLNSKDYSTDYIFSVAYPKLVKYAIDMTEKELKQAVEGMYHNLNTLQSRSGNQLPFTSINYGTCTLLEGRMVTKALLEGSIEGVGKVRKTPIFPCGIFQCMKGINRKPGEPNYDLFQLALKSTAQRLYPNYANIDWSNNEGYDRNDPRTYFGTMGCRTANLWDINGFGQLKDGRGNICPVTIVLPTLAMEAKEKAIREGFGNTDKDCLDPVSAFIELLDKKIYEAKDMLIERFDYICSQPAESAKFMYENGLMAGYVPEEGIRSALKHGTLAMGQIGMAETLQILIGCDHTEEKGMELAKRIEQLFKDRCSEFKQKYKLNFGVYYTPRLLGLGVA